MKLNPHIHIVGSGSSGFSMTNPFDCTVYLVDGGSELALIDAGVGLDVVMIINNIQNSGFDPRNIRYILLTHAHGDHAGGAYKLSEICGAEVLAMQDVAKFVSEADIDALSLRRAIEAGVYPSGYEFIPCPVTPINNGDTIKVGNLSLKAILTEGHSAGHCCYLLEIQGKKALFAGDCIFHGGKISLQSTWDCDLQKYMNSLHIIEKIGVDLLLPSHNCISMSNGRSHIEKAITTICSLGVPKNIIGE